MCACKGNSSSRQVSQVKQIVKKPSEKLSTSKPVKKTVTRQIVFKRHM